jgi:hypothetical protein
MKTQQANPWTTEDDLAHRPSVMEWWCAEAFFTTQEDNKQWSLKAAMVEWLEHKKKIGSNVNITLFDQKTKKHYVYYSRDDTKQLEITNNPFKIRYEKSYITGAYPQYSLFFDDPKHNIQLHLTCDADSIPHWVAQDITNGWLPLGLGFYRYGFIPRCKLTGIMKRDEKQYHIDGVGYYEHVWGTFSYSSPIKNILSLKKTMGTYAKLGHWWIANHHVKIPNSIQFSTDNNPLGYDWVWAILDNGWTIFYGNILFWVMKGPSAGSLILSTNGKHYTEFCDVHFKYLHTRYAQNHDFFYPSELLVTARNKKEKLHLTFTMTAESREYISPFKGSKYWLGLAICESPGTVIGYYDNGSKKIPLQGVCKIEPQRQISRIGHNSLRIDFIKPPHGIGVSFDLHSHLIKKKIAATLQFLPHPKLRGSIQKIDPSQINKK